MFVHGFLLVRCSVKSLHVSIAILFSLFCANCFGSTLTAKVSQVGCHRDINMCFVYLDQKPITSCTLNDNSLRWDGRNDPNASAILSILLSAEAQGKKVTFGGAGDTCYSNFPTFTWLHIDE